MTSLTLKFSFTINPAPPYSFSFTLKNPAGWFLFTPFEIYEDGALWTATHFDTLFAGLKMTSTGTIEDPGIIVDVYALKPITPELQVRLKNSLEKAVGAEQDLREFYEIAGNDSILTHVRDDLYGMHDRFPVSIFPEAVLAILLQMAPLKRSNEMMASFILSYGETAEFDGKKIYAWPTPGKISGLYAEELAAKCKVGYRARSIVKLAKKLEEGGFPTTDQLLDMQPEEAKKFLLKLPGIGDYSADIISPHGGFPIDAWSAEVFSMLFFRQKPENNREAVDRVKKEGLRRWGKWSWMAFFYIVQDLPGLSEKLDIELRLT